MCLPNAVNLKTLDTLEYFETLETQASRRILHVKLDTSYAYQATIILTDASSFAHISLVRMYQSQSTKMISGNGRRLKHSYTKLLGWTAGGERISPLLGQHSDFFTLLATFPLVTRICAHAIEDNFLPHLNHEVRHPPSGEHNCRGNEMVINSTSRSYGCKLEEGLERFASPAKTRSSMATVQLSARL